MTARGCGPDCPCGQPFYRPADRTKLVFSTGSRGTYEEIAPNVFVFRYVLAAPEERAE